MSRLALLGGGQDDMKRAQVLDDESQTNDYARLGGRQGGLPNDRDNATARFEVGDRVSICNLTSAAGLPLNSRSAVVRSRQTNGRLGVEIGGVDRLMSIKEENLESVSVHHEAPMMKLSNASGPGAPISSLVLSHDELHEQAVIAESLRHTCAPGAIHTTAPAVNAQVSDALLRTRSIETGPKVVILKYRRVPKAFKEALASSPLLAPRREALEAHSFAAVFEKGAHIFVKPEHYIATTSAIHANGMQLYSSHVVVESELADHVDALAKSVHEKAYPCGSTTLSIGYPVNFDVQRTFISVAVGSSLLSSSVECPPRTV